MDKPKPNALTRYLETGEKAAGFTGRVRVDELVDKPKPMKPAPCIVGPDGKVFIPVGGTREQIVAFRAYLDWLQAKRVATLAKAAERQRRYRARKAAGK